MYLIHILLAFYKAGQEHAVQQLKQSIFFPIVLLVLGFSYFWDRGNSGPEKQDLQEVKHHVNISVDELY